MSSTIPIDKKSRHERREAFFTAVSEPEAIEEICDRIASGETLVDIAAGYEANYRWLYQWLYDSEFPERARLLENSMNARDSMAKEDIIGQLHRLGNIDVAKAYDKDGELLPIHEMPVELRKAISSFDVSVSEDGDITTKKLRFVDRGQMLALGGRRQKLFVDKVEMSGQMSLEQAVTESMAQNAKPKE